MTWTDLTTESQSSQQVEEQKAKAQALSQLVHRVFSTTDGHELLAHLTNTFIINNDTALNAENYSYELAYHNGEAGTVRYIIHQMNRAEQL